MCHLAHYCPVFAFPVLALTLQADDTTAPSSPVTLVAAASGSNLVSLSWAASTDDVKVTRYLVERCKDVDCTNFVQVATLPAWGMCGPLRVSETNTRYFADRTGKVVLLGGSHHWLNFIDSGTNYPPPPFDYKAYLDFISSHHHNFFRLWMQGLPKKNYGIQDAGPWYQSPQPWPRTGPGNATDGLPKFDLSQFNPAFFDRLRLCVREANARGIYVSVMLFDGYHVQFGRRSDDGYPLTGANNINGVDDGGGTRSHNLSVIPGAVLAAEENYVRRVIDTVNDLPNVLYEIANEAGPYSTAWQQYFIAFVKNYEGGKPFQHPVGFTFQHSGGSDSTLYSSDADWVSPSDNAASNDGTRPVILNDTDHSYFWTGMKEDGPQLNRAFVWMNFTAGNSALFMDPYLMPWTTEGNVRNSPGGCVSGPSCTSVDPLWDSIRKNIGYMLDYANGRLELVKMTPQTSLISSGSCLASDVSMGAEYFTYRNSSSSFTLDLRATTRLLTVEWFDPETGAIISGGTVTGGSSAQSFTPPFSGDSILYLVDAAAHAVQAEVAYDDADLTGKTVYRYRVRAMDAAGNIGDYSPIANAIVDAILLAVPPQTAAQIAQNGFRFFVSADSPTVCALEFATNLTVWQEMSTIQYTNGQVLVVDSNVTASATRFYRARKL